MHPLNPFERLDLAEFPVGEIEISAKGLVLNFQWDESWQFLPELSPGQGHSPQRKNKLWESTCFEAFIKRESDGRYWEVNLSPLGDWNVYAFSSYRNPQPPTEDGTFTLGSFHSQKGRIRAEFSGYFIPDVYRIGLACITDLKQHGKVYWALKHAGEKPDFHDPQSFVIERIVK